MYSLGAMSDGNVFSGLSSVFLITKFTPWRYCRNNSLTFHTRTPSATTGMRGASVRRGEAPLLHIYLYVYMFIPVFIPIGTGRNAYCRRRRGQFMTCAAKCNAELALLRYYGTIEVLSLRQGINSKGHWKVRCFPGHPINPLA